MALMPFVVLVFCLSGKVFSSAVQQKGFSSEKKQQILDFHNSYRSEVAKGKGCNGQPKACNMQALVWCEELETGAQRHASDCSGPSHDVRSTRATTNFPDVGQNMMDCLKGSATCPMEAKQGFTEECPGYTYSSNACDTSKAGRAGTCGHYTALVWANSRCLAAGYDACPSASYKNARMVVNYGPGGNVAGEKPYKEGEPCSCCAESQKCLDGLCIDAAVCSQDGLKCTDAHSECKDLMSACSSYAGAGYCDGAYEAYMTTNCPSACNRCTPKVVPRNSAIKVNTNQVTTAETCLKGVGTHYKGDISKTKSNKECQNWADNSPHSVSYYDFEFVDGSKANAKNFCRNPGGSSSGPWCYTTDANTRWEYCDIPSC